MPDNFAIKRQGSLNTSSVEDRLDTTEGNTSINATDIVNLEFGQTGVLGYNIVVGDATEVAANIATNVISDLDDTLVVVGSKVLFLDGTHTLTANLSLSNTDIVIDSESSQAIIEADTYTLTFSGARNRVRKLRAQSSDSAGLQGIIVSGADSEFSGIGVAAADVTIGTGNQYIQQDLTLGTNFITGFVPSHSADTDHDMSITAGQFRDSANIKNVVSTITYEKQIDAPWATGNAAGGQFDPFGNLTTATLDSATLDTGANFVRMTFKPDGTELYVIDGTTDEIKQYTLSVAWDLSTATFASQTLDISAFSGSKDLSINSDGTTVFILGPSATDNVLQYTMSVPWDISSATFDSINFTLANTDIYQALFVSPDGTKMFVTDGTADTVEQYLLTSVWDLSTAQTNSVVFDASAQDINIY